MLKQVTYVAYMLKIISLTGFPHFHEFLEKINVYVTFLFWDVRQGSEYASNIRQPTLSLQKWYEN